jgi:hypothetical protein
LIEDVPTFIHTYGNVYVFYQQLRNQKIFTRHLPKAEIRWIFLPFHLIKFKTDRARGSVASRLAHDNTFYYKPVRWVSLDYITNL